MKSWITLGAVVIFIAMIGFGLWVLTKPIDVPSAPVAETPAAPTPIPVAPKPAPAPVAPVVVAPPVVAPAPITPVQAAVEAAPAVHIDPTTDLSTAIPDFTQLVVSGDYLTAVETYVELPQGVDSQQFIAAVKQNPNYPVLVQQVTDTMKAAKDVTPTYNDTGDVATYTFDQPIDGKSAIHWRKVDGHWFFEN